MRTQHPWSQAAATGFGRRFATGLIAALGLTLAAFEWRTPGAPPRHWPGELEWEEDRTAYPKVVVIEQQQAQRQRPQRAPRSGGPVQAGEEPQPEPDGDRADAGAHDANGAFGEGDPDAPTANPDEVIDDGPRLWDGVEQRPYFRKCLGLPRGAIDSCTAALVDQHLKRRFRVPEGLRREERTTVSIVIDAEGRIARVHCAPAPSAPVEQEIRRVIGELPPMMPGTQNGRPVPVVFQLPFRVARF